MPIGLARSVLTGYAPVGFSRPTVTFTAVGNAQIDTAQSAVGSSSIYFDGTGDYVTGDTNFSEYEWTLEFWFREDVRQNCKYIGGQTAGDIFIGHDGNAYANRLGGGIVGVGWNLDFGLTTVADQWYHLAVSKSGTTLRAFLDGDLKTTLNNTGMASYNSGIARWRSIVLGAETTGNTPYYGWLDEIRLSKVARYTANFTPPSSPLTNDADTLFLIHAEGADGSTSILDDN